MGMLDTSFGMFCEGLAVNATLQVLDIRNNQITHDGASELAGALKRNRALKSLGRCDVYAGIVTCLLIIDTIMENCLNRQLQIIFISDKGISLTRD